MGATAAVTWAACGMHDRPTLGGGSQGGEGSQGGSTANGFVTDGAVICGADVHHPVTHPPLVYFVLDRSGSMEDDAGDGSTRWAHVRDAAVTIVDDLGALVRVGAAVFPAAGAGDGEECQTGAQVYSPTADSSPSGFENAIDHGTFGGTPISATLAALTDTIVAEEAPRAVILATDGAPNCNAGTSCSPSDCMVNIFGECPADVTNCCDPAEGGTWLNCVDRMASVHAVQSLSAAGADVYVVGIPGSEKFANILDQLAVVGGVPRQDADSFYYRVDDLDTLSAVFKSIAASLVSCTFDLSDPPEAPGKTNVYFDEQVVLQDPVNGWIWVDADTVELEGAACEELKTGNVSEVKIVSGCPTATPR